MIIGDIRQFAAVVTMTGSAILAVVRAPLSLAHALSAFGARLSTR
jgi:hypothetical protein